MGQARQRLNVDLDQIVECRGGHLSGQAERAEAGIVDEKIDVLAPLDQRGDARQVVAVAEVGRHDLDRDIGLGANVARGLFETLAAARDEDQMIAAGGEPLRIGDTDPRRRAGDNCETLVITH